MRVLPLVIILALLGAVGYVYFFHWDDVSRMVRGYRAAQTPDEAMAYFEKAVKSRDYKTASLYCTGEYAEYLRKADAPARSIGKLMDRFVYYMKEQGLERPATMAALYFFDPFPPFFRQKGAPKIDDKKQDSALGVFELDTLELDANSLASDDTVDGKMFKTVLTPWLHLQAISPQKQVGIPIKQVEENGTKSWKLDIPLSRPDDINYFLNHYKAYETGLNHQSTYLTMERIASKDELGGLVMKVYRDAKD